MSISVIIPVHNTEKYIRAAVFSAVQQKETGEVLLIDDGSTDDSLKTCYQVAADYSNVRVLQHPFGAHKGLAATRNLGIRETSFELVAFLDADDYFLPKRFSAPFRTLALRPEVDVVYEAIETFFEPESHKDAYMEIHGKTLIAMDAPYTGSDLLGAIASGRQGYTSLVGLLVRREALIKVGMFDEDLDMHDNTALVLKLAAATQMVPGRLNRAVTRRRVHTNNKSLTNSWDIPEMWRVVWYWTQKQTQLSSHTYDTILAYYLDNTLGKHPEIFGRRRALKTMGYILGIVNQYPSLVKRSPVWRYLKKLSSSFKINPTRRLTALETK